MPREAVLQGTSPWGSAQRVVVSVGWTLALCTVGFAWFATSGEATLGHQVRWVTVAAGGVMLAGAVSGAWLLAGRRAVGLRALDALPLPDEGDLADVVDLRVKAVLSTAPPASDGAAASAELVAAPGMRYFHRPDCPLTQGKAVATAARNEHVRLGRTACEVCRP